MSKNSDDGYESDACSVVSIQVDDRLFQAVLSENIALVEEIINSGANVSPWVPGGYVSLLSMAVNMDDVAIARLLLEHGAEVESRNSEGETLLVRAVAMGNTEMVSLLLEYGAEPSECDSDGVDLLSIAGDNEDIINMLREALNPAPAAPADAAAAEHEFHELENPSTDVPSLGESADH